MSYRLYVCSSVLRGVDSGPSVLDVGDGLNDGNLNDDTHFCSHLMDDIDDDTEVMITSIINCPECANEIDAHFKPFQKIVKCDKCSVSYERCKGCGDFLGRVK